MNGYRLILVGLVLVLVLGSVALLVIFGQTDMGYPYQAGSEFRVTPTWPQFLSVDETSLPEDIQDIIKARFGILVLADLDGNGDDDLIVLTKEQEGDTEQQAEPTSGIIDGGSEGGDYMIRFEGSVYNSEPQIVDVTGDGLPDLVYETGTGGNSYQSTWSRIIWWDGARYRQQDIGRVKWFYDMDQDGLLELETTVAITELDRRIFECDPSMNLARVYQGGPSSVWRWNGNGFADVSSTTPEFYSEVLVPRLRSAGKRWNMAQLAKHEDEALRLLCECLQDIDRYILDWAELRACPSDHVQ